MYKKGADGVTHKGKTKAKVVKMASGGAVRGGGCEAKGKTRGKMIKMAGGGRCA